MLMQLPKPSPSRAGPKCALRNSVCTNEGLSVTENWHRSKGKGVNASDVCTVQTFVEKGGQGLVFSLSRFLITTKLTELLSGLSLNRL